MDGWTDGWMDGRGVEELSQWTGDGAFVSSDNEDDFRRVKQAIKYRRPSIRPFSLPLFFTVVIRQ